MHTYACVYIHSFQRFDFEEDLEQCSSKIKNKNYKHISVAADLKCPNLYVSPCNNFKKSYDEHAMYLAVSIYHSSLSDQNVMNFFLFFIERSIAICRIVIDDQS